MLLIGDIFNNHTMPNDDGVCHIYRGPTSKRRLSEKMAAWFKGLQITNGQETLGSNNAELGQDSYQDGWQRFCELEKR